MNLAGHASDNFGRIAGFLRSVMKEIGDAVLLTTSVLCRWATKCRIANRTHAERVGSRGGEGIVSCELNLEVHGTSGRPTRHTWQEDVELEEEFLPMKACYAGRVWLLVSCVLTCLFGGTRVLWSQSTNASISGQITDAQGRAVPEVEVVAINTGTNVTFHTKTNSSGIYSLPALPPGEYRLVVRRDGFKEINKIGYVLHVQDALEQNFALEVGSVNESVTVEGGAPLINTQDAAVSTVVDRQFAENLPLNGRSFETLIELTPGVVLTPYSNYDNGQFSVNGQRASSNYWMVDGVSANVGIGTSQFSAGNGLSGSNASFSALGGTNSLVSVDALQEFRIQTSTFAPEFGRTPGGQISIVTRSGANQWHGSLFEYLRNDIFDANNWFVNRLSQPKPEERQNDFGGTLSGPILKNRTFFFFSYEGLRLRVPKVTQSTVPDLAARQGAAPATQPYLNAFPLPSPNTPDDVANGIGHFNASYSNSATLDAYSLRIDHRWRDELALFVRLNYSPSKSNQRGTGTLNDITSSKVRIETGTIGATWTFSTASVNDFRVNYSRTRSTSLNYMDGFGGGVPLASLPFPPGFDASNGRLLVGVFSLSPLGPRPGVQGHNLQRQINIVDSLSVQKASHSLKVGVDYRRLTPIFRNGYFQQDLFLSVPSLANGNIFASVIQSGTGGSFLFNNLGLFGQDTWRVKPKLTITYGLRWEVDFAPSSNPALLAVTGFNLADLSALALAPTGTPPFQTTYGNLAPRIGIAYQLLSKNSWQTVVRGGFGVFYDLATAEVGNTLGQPSYPFGASKTVFGKSFGGSATFPLSATDATPPPIVPANLQTFGAGGLFDPNLKLPYTLQWNLALEQSLGAMQALSASYVGASGRRLLQTAGMGRLNANFASANLITNLASSDYHALQVQFQRRLSHGLQALTSYTWSHSIDTASAGSVFGNGANALILGAVNQNRGPSDFDIRDAFSVGMTYDIPTLKTNAFATAILRGWSLQNVIQARSAPPVNIATLNFLTTFMNSLALIRPDVIPGVPFYLYGGQYPGGKAINPAAFTPPPKDSKGNPLRQGNLGRNALRGFGAAQWDFAVHRDFPIRESLRLQFRAEMFNILNHPNFGPPVSNLSNKTQFGQSTQLLDDSLAGFNVGSGAFSPLYQIGGPRSVQFGLKVQF
jgi:hypothetical protein